MTLKPKRETVDKTPRQLPGGRWIGCRHYVPTEVEDERGNKRTVVTTPGWDMTRACVVPHEHV